MPSILRRYAHGSPRSSPIVPVYQGLVGVVTSTKSFPLAADGIIAYGHYDDGRASVEM